MKTRLEASLKDRERNKGHKETERNRLFTVLRKQDQIRGLLVLRMPISYNIER